MSRLHLTAKFRKRGSSLSTRYINLVYIDPPFDTGADFSFTAMVPDHPDTTEDDSFEFTKEPSIIEQKAYRDTWGRGLDSYLRWFYATVNSKSRAARLWCENASTVTGTPWSFVIVRQSEYQSLQPTDFSDLEALKSQDPETSRRESKV